MEWKVTNMTAYPPQFILERTEMRPLAVVEAVQLVQRWNCLRRLHWTETMTPLKEMKGVTEKTGQSRRLGSLLRPRGNCQTGPAAPSYPHHEFTHGRLGMGYLP